MLLRNEAARGWLELWPSYPGGDGLRRGHFGKALKICRLPLSSKFLPKIRESRSLLQERGLKFDLSNF